MTSTSIAPPEEPRQLGMFAAAKYLAFHLRSYGRAAARPRTGATADWRTPDAVSVLHDGMRQPVFDRRGTLSWDEVLYGQAPPGTTVLVADRLAHGSYRVPR